MSTRAAVLFSAEALCDSGMVRSLPASGRSARLVSHPIFRAPAFGSHHPLSTGRHGAALDLASALGWMVADSIVTAPLVDGAMLARLHDGHYLDAFEQATTIGRATVEQRQRYNLATMECPLFPGLRERAEASVGGSLLSADLALAGHVAFHPGGGTHHGQRDRASGFCYFNDPAFAILRFLDAGLGRVLYLDLDAHHGDGVEAIWGGDDRVRLVSLHEADRWPGSGLLGQTSDGRALNVPTPRGVTDPEYALLLSRALPPVIERFRPRALVLTLGADALAGDPLSAMKLTNRLLWRIMLAAVAAIPCAVILGGGGYNPWTTARLWAGTWGLLSGHELPDRLADTAQGVLAGLDCDLIDEEDRDPRWTSHIGDAAETEEWPPADRCAVRTQVKQLADAVAARAGALRPA